MINDGYPVIFSSSSQMSIKFLYLRVVKRTQGLQPADSTLRHCWRSTQCWWDLQSAPTRAELIVVGMQWQWDHGTMEINGNQWDIQIWTYMNYTYGGFQWGFPARHGAPVLIHLKQSYCRISPGFPHPASWGCPIYGHLHMMIWIWKRPESCYVVRVPEVGLPVPSNASKITTSSEVGNVVLGAADGQRGPPGGGWTHLVKHQKAAEREPKNGRKKSWAKPWRYLAHQNQGGIFMKNGASFFSQRREIYQYIDGWLVMFFRCLCDFWLWKTVPAEMRWFMVGLPSQQTRTKGHVNVPIRQGTSILGGVRDDFPGCGWWDIHQGTCDIAFLSRIWCKKVMILT